MQIVGGRMYNHRGGSYDYTNSKTSKTYKKKCYDKYTCSLNQIHKNDCSMHYISTESVSTLILETIKMTTEYARDNEAEFMQIITEASVFQQGETIKSHERQIINNEKRIAELDTLFKKTYEDFAAERLTEKRFAVLSSGYEAEQEALETETIELKKALEQFDSDSLRADKFLELAKKYTDFTELTAPILHEFVEKVFVYEADKSSGKREQQVDIYLNYIGQFTPPMDTDPDEEAEEKRAMWREYKRSQREKMKQGHNIEKGADEDTHTESIS